MTSGGKSADRRLERLAVATALALCLTAAPTQAADNAELGAYLSNECVTCHQRSGASNGIPSITGWPQDAFVSALRAYRGRERKSPVMQTIADQLSDEEIAALAAYFGSLGRPAGELGGSGGTARPAAE